MAVQFRSSDNDKCKYGLPEDTIATEDWMSALPANLQHIPLSKLAIPGTHDSGTFSCSSVLAPNTDACLAFLTKLKFVKRIICNWAQCQSLNITEQLLAGIRYFDLRVTTYPGSEDFFLVHTVLGPKVSDVVEAVLMFLETHAHEIVLLDFNHFYSMDATYHKKLIQYLISKIGSKVCNRCDIGELTLTNLWKQGEQVIIFYQNDAACGVEEVWPANRITSPWPNTDNPRACIEYLTQTFSKLFTRDFTVCQGILTPTANTVVKGLFHHGNIKTLSKTLLPLLCPWVGASPHHCAYPLNIVIADYINDGDLIQIILGLNYKRTVCA